MSEKNYHAHPTAIVESETIGAGTRIWAYAHVMRGVRIGADCNLGDHTFIESGVTIGDEVTIKNGVSIWDGVTIGNHVFIGPNVCFTNDLRPRSKVFHEQPDRTVICSSASIGANATILPCLTIGEYALVGAGSVVTRDVRPFEMVYGNPAKHAGWVSVSGESLEFVDGVAESGGKRYVLREDGVVFENS